MQQKTVFTTSYFDKYITLVNETNFVNAFEIQEAIIEEFLTSITEEKSNYAYAKDKWTLKELLQHIIDTERILSYRALAIARKETTTLPGFDENKYSANSAANNRTWTSLASETNIVRTSTKLLFESFTVDMLQNEGRFGTATGTPEKLGFIIIGHMYHHLNIVKERYF